MPTRAGPFANPGDQHRQRLPAPDEVQLPTINPSLFSSPDLAGPAAAALSLVGQRQVPGSTDIRGPEFNMGSSSMGAATQRLFRSAPPKIDSHQQAQVDMQKMTARDVIVEQRKRQRLASVQGHRTWTPQRQHKFATDRGYNNYQDWMQGGYGSWESTQRVNPKTGVIERSFRPSAEKPDMLQVQAIEANLRMAAEMGAWGKVEEIMEQSRHIPGMQQSEMYRQLEVGRQYNLFPETDIQKYEARQRAQQKRQIAVAEHKRAGNTVEAESEARAWILNTDLDLEIPADLRASNPAMEQSYQDLKAIIASANSDSGNVARMAAMEGRLNSVRAAAKYWRAEQEKKIQGIAAKMRQVLPEQHESMLANLTPNMRAKVQERFQMGMPGDVQKEEEPPTPGERMQTRGSLRKEAQSYLTGLPDQNTARAIALGQTENFAPGEAEAIKQSMSPEVLGDMREEFIANNSDMGLEEDELARIFDQAVAGLRLPGVTAPPRRSQAGTSRNRPMTRPPGGSPPPRTRAGSGQAGPSSPGGGNVTPGTVPSGSLGDTAEGANPAPRSPIGGPATYEPEKEGGWKPTALSYTEEQKFQQWWKTDKDVQAWKKWHNLHYGFEPKAGASRGFEAGEVEYDYRGAWKAGQGPKVLPTTRVGPEHGTASDPTGEDEMFDVSAKEPSVNTPETRTWGVGGWEIPLQWDRLKEDIGGRRDVNPYGWSGDYLNPDWQAPKGKEAEYRQTYGYGMQPPSGTEESILTKSEYTYWEKEIKRDARMAGAPAIDSRTGVDWPSAYSYGFRPYEEGGQVGGHLVDPKVLAIEMDPDDADQIREQEDEVIAKIKTGTANRDSLKRQIRRIKERARKARIARNTRISNEENQRAVERNIPKRPSGLPDLAKTDMPHA